MISCSLIIVLFFVSLVAGETQIATFIDHSCRTSATYFTAVDGYPDGACMNITHASNATYGSFMVTSLDNGCLITVYGNDSNNLICSSTTLEFANELSCYNSSWIYLSIDRCVNPDVPSSSSNASSANSSGSKDHAGDIAGGVVGGVAGLAVLLGAGYYAWYRRRSARHSPNQAVAGADPSMAEADPCAEAYILEMEHPEKLAEAPSGPNTAEMEGTLPVEMEAPLGRDPNASFIIRR